MSERNNDLIYKYIIIGDQSVGKTSLLNRFINNSFNETYQETIGVDYQTQYFDFNKKCLRLQWWDAGGNEKYRSIVSAYFRSTAGIIAVYDITNKRSFDSLKMQLNCLKKHLSLEKLFVYLIGNKTDLDEDREVCFEEVKEYAIKNDFLLTEFSAKTSYLTTELLTEIVKESILRKDRKVISSARSLNREKSLCSLPRVTEDRHSARSQHSARSNKTINASCNSLLLNRKNSDEKNLFVDVKEKKFKKEFIKL